jgi:hypothetical protein
LQKPAKRLSARETVERLTEIANDIDLLLPLLHDPQEMKSAADLLKAFPVEQDANLLEYLGDSPTRRDRLKPFADATIKLYDGAAQLAKSQCDALVRQIGPNNNPVIDRWEKLDTLAQLAGYERNMSVYFEMLATDPKDPARQAMAQQADKQLQAFDKADSGVQARVRNMRAKLAMASGDHAAARNLLASVYDAKGDIKPPANSYELADARYFQVVNDILAKDLPAAKKDLADWDQWRTGAYPGIVIDERWPVADAEKAASSVAASGDLLRWRIALLQRDLANTPEAKQQATRRAAEALHNFTDKRPDLADEVGKDAAPPTTSTAPSAPGLMANPIGPGDPSSFPFHHWSRSNFTFTPPHPPPPDNPIFGPVTNARRIVFVCNGCASMAAKMPALKAALHESIYGLRVVQSFNIIFFGDKSPRQFDPDAPLRLATPQYKRNAHNFIDDIKAAGGNDPLPAIDLAFQAKPQLIYLLTDGDFPDNDAVLKQIRVLNKEKKIRIVTIALISAADTDMAFKSMLKTIATENGGSFRSIDVKDLPPPASRP